MGELAPTATALAANPNLIDSDLSHALRTAPIDSTRQQQVISHARDLEQGLMIPGLMPPDPSNPTCRWATGLGAEAARAWLEVATDTALGLPAEEWSTISAAATIVLLGPASTRTPQQQELGRQFIEDCRHVPLSLTICNVPGHVRPAEGEPGCTSCRQPHVRELLAMLHDVHPTVIDENTTPDRRALINLQCTADREALWQQGIAATADEQLRSAMTYVTNKDNWTYNPTPEHAAKGVGVFFGAQCREELIKRTGCTRAQCDRVHGILPEQRAMFPNAAVINGDEYKRIAESSHVLHQGIPTHPYHRKVCLNYYLGRCPNAQCTFSHSAEQYGLDASNYEGCKVYYDKVRAAPPAGTAAGLPTEEVRLRRRLAGGRWLCHPLPRSGGGAAAVDLPAAA
eukprot:gene12733-17377_t